MADENLNQKLVKLNHLQRDIEEAKSERGQKIGERTAILADLKRRFGIGTKEKATQRIINLDNQVTRRNKSIEKQFQTLKDRYDF